MKNENKSKIKININQEDPEINQFLYCWDKFGDIPNKIKIYNSFSKDSFIELIDKYIISKNTTTEIIADIELDIINDKVLIQISETIYLSYVILDRENDSSFIHEINFFFKSQSDSKMVDELIEKINSSVLDFKEEDHYKLNTIYLSANGIEIESVEKLVNDNINLYYNQKTLKNINKLVKNINKSDKGLSILYGDRGTGKTNIISYICDKLDRIVIFIPNNLIESTINNQEFRAFLKKYNRPIIVIDDCEVLFNDMFSKSNIYTNNLLQIVEGFLSDSIQVNIIAIFNTDNVKEIDNSLLDSNSLIDLIKFEDLTSDESSKLSKHLGFGKKYKNKTRLVDIIKNNNSSTNYIKTGF
jgi:hypothetical protein